MFYPYKTREKKHLLFLKNAPKKGKY